MVRCVFCLFGRKASLTKILLMMAFFKLTLDNIVPVQKQTRVTHFIITVDSNKSIQRLSRVFLQRPSSHTADKRNRAAAMTVLAHCQTYEIQFCIINLYYTISW